jgi:hypothetical protein
MGSLVRWYWKCGILPFVPIAWPWLSVATLLIFRWSMRRARIRDIHVLRCCLYSFDGLWWAGLLLAVGYALISYVLLFAIHPAQSIWVCLLAIVFGIYRLCLAYMHYLRFDRPLATVFVSQLMVLLACLCAWQLIDPSGPVEALFKIFGTRLV